MSVQPADLVKLLSDRILELMPYGLYRLWFCVKGGSSRVLAMVLGYSEETLRNIVLFTPLSRGDGNYMVDNWSNLLKVPVHKTRHGQDVYVRFGPIQGGRREFMSAEERQMHHDAAVTAPNDAFQDDFLVDFLERVMEKKSMLRDARLSGDFQRWLSDQWRALGSNIAVQEEEVAVQEEVSDDESDSDEISSDCFDMTNFQIS